MAAYAALTSLKYIIDQLRDHPSPPISLDEQQAESLTEKVTFLQEFLETYHSPVADSNEADPLEMRIADAAYAAEDVIESHIVDMIQLRRSTTTTTTTFQPIIDSGEGTSSSGGSKKQKKPIMSFNSFGFLMKPINYGKKIDSKYGLHQGMRKVIKGMDLIKKDVMEIKKEKAIVIEAHVPASGGSSSRSSVMVELDDVLLQILDKLTGGHNHRQVIPIVGMGGIGKTTLALHIYALPLIKERFDVCAWAAISQKYNPKEILSELLSQANKKSKEELSYMSEDKVGSELYQYLFSRRFLIVLDDMWSIEAWEEIQHLFPENGNGSRIVVTTRLSNLGSELDISYCLKMKFLDKGCSWDLFSKSVFGEEGCCPLELIKIGKQIVENCRGLPLSIVVVGGLLRKMEHTRECWESIRENSSSVVNSENEDFSLKILKTSYNHLPVYLKPCFLYMGVFEEDSAVRVSSLVKLWVSEGFLKPISGKSLETAAKGYLTDLVDRNLILVHELGSTGSIKYCKVHDLLRDLCSRTAEKEGFYNVIGQHRLQGLDRKRRAVVRESTSKEEVDDALQSMPHARSFVCHSKKVRGPLPESRLLRILKAYDRDRSGGHGYELVDDVLRLVNLRYLAVEVHHESKFPLSLSLLWNLHTIVIFHPVGETAPNEIWKMPQLRHVEFHKGYLRLPVPILELGSRNGSVVIMKNLQTLKGVRFLAYSKSSTVIPNIKKLGVADGYLTDVHHLTKLESYRSSGYVFEGQYFAFPHSLKKLSLGAKNSHWEVNEVLLEKIGALPHLQKLQFIRAQFPRCKQETVEGQLKEWATSEGQFPSLKFLELNSCLLESWTVESSHFSRLEKLCLFGMKELEIPPEIGDIPTLQLILLKYCSESVVVSAKSIAEEQEDLQVRVLLFNKDNTNNQRKVRKLRELRVLLWQDL